jgi:hypothetical protein
MTQVMFNRIGAASILAILCVGIASAVETTSTNIDSSRLPPQKQAPVAPQSNGWQSPSSPREDAAIAGMWQINLAELARARMLMQGPRGAFGSAVTSPLEALGIHATTTAEKKRYAKLFAQVTIDDAMRVSDWVQTVSNEARTLVRPIAVSAAPSPVRPNPRTTQTVSGLIADERPQSRTAK